MDKKKRMGLSADRNLMHVLLREYGNCKYEVNALLMIYYRKVFKIK